MISTLRIRRSFLPTTAAAAMAGNAKAAPAVPRKKIALIGTALRKHSHAQSFLDRHAPGYTWDGGWQQPRVDLASLYIAQFPEGDLARSRATLFMLPIQHFNYAGLDGETGAITSCQMYLPMPGSSATTSGFFNPQVHYIETMVLEKRAPYPVERTLLTSGMTLAAVESLHRDGAVIEKPEIEVRYTVPNESFVWRD